MIASIQNPFYNIVAAQNSRVLFFFDEKMKKRDDDDDDHDHDHDHDAYDDDHDADADYDAGDDDADATRQIKESTAERLTNSLFRKIGFSAPWKGLNSLRVEFLNG